MPVIETDYLVIGAGAMGMAFVDVMLAETDASFVMVDRYHRPGGHWNTAYPFVRLHQPSTFYGVNSKPLGSDAIDRNGSNKGLYELATSDEVCAYFNGVMQQDFLPSGRVTYFPMSEFEGDGKIRSNLTGEVTEVRCRKAIVDSTYMRVTVPSMRSPSYEVAEGVTCVPPNDLGKIKQPYAQYCVVGAGKTGMDVCLWLLAMGIAPARITWIMPRDSWLLDRALIQPGEQFRPGYLAGLEAQKQAILQANSIDELFDALEQGGQLLRLTPDVRPEMYRCATVSQLELEQLRTLSNIVRLGRVSKIEPHRVYCEKGDIPASTDTIYIDCTADGLEKRKSVPVFNGDTITLQSVRPCQQVFSAAFIAHVEAGYTDEAHKNELCTPVPHPDNSMDWLRTTVATFEGESRWNSDPALVRWLREARLDWFGRLMPPLPEGEEAKAAFLSEISREMDQMREKLLKLLDPQAAAGKGWLALDTVS